jgi:hypothetical protein
MRPPLRLILISLAIAATAGAVEVPAPPPAPVGGLAAISQAALLTDVAHLADPALGGRVAGSAGFWQAAGWAADRFRALGLQPGGDDGYFQRFTCEYNEFLTPPRLRIDDAAGEMRECVLGPDFLARGFSGQGEVAAGVVFVGYGQSIPDRGYDDYAGVDVTGKIVLCFKRNPAWQPADGAPWPADSGLARVRSAAAAAHGAAALLWFELPAPGDTVSRPPIASVMHGPGPMPTGFPQLEISEGTADRLLGGPGEARRLRDLIDGDKAPHSRAAAGRAEINVQTAYDAAHPTCNVVAILPGSDAQRRDQALVIGAHLDHVGRQSPTVYFPGANDNASGSAAVLRLAAAFAAAPVAPARTVVFVLFSGEEAGLEGSRYQVSQPARPLADTVAMFNLDCVAHGDSIKVGSGKTSPELWALAHDLDSQNAKMMVEATWADGGADATPFHEAGVKTLYWVTTNSYTHLHLASDKPETLNGPLYAELVRLAFRTAWAVANGS